jgi:hypothetical protein
MASGLDPEFIKQAELGFMRLHPALAALDADRDGAISADEIGNSPAALRTLDSDGDGSLIAPELLPAPGANEAAMYLSRHDTNRDGRISHQERSSVSDKEIRELLERADRNQDGNVDGKELATELRLRAAKQQALENAVRSAFGPPAAPANPRPVSPPPGSENRQLP